MKKTNYFRGTPEQRFWRYVNKTDGCWEWLAAKSRGYGRFGLKDKAVLAHRFAYELLRGPITPGLVTDHLCRNRGCVNPAHIELVTNKENCLRGVSGAAQNARKTHCDRGHLLSGDNLRLQQRVARGGRYKYVIRMCRECNRLRCKARRKIGNTKFSVSQ